MSNRAGSIGAAARLSALCCAALAIAGCAPRDTIIASAPAECADVQWLLAIPFGGGRAVPRQVDALYPPQPCDADLDCPPGTACHGDEGSGTCRAVALSTPQAALDSDGASALPPAPRFSLEVIQDGGAHRLRLARVPDRAHFALCSFYSCPVDERTITRDSARCLLETREVDLTTGDNLLIPPATASSRATPIERRACQKHPGTDEAIRLRLTPTGFAAMCVAYQPSGIAAISEIIALRPEEIGAFAGDSYQPTCSPTTTGSACHHPRVGSNQLGICVAEHCCVPCVSSVPAGARIEQACASVGEVVVDAEDERYVQMGYARFGVCVDPSGRPVCRAEGFIPADAPSASCVPRSEPQLDQPFAREYDGDGDGVSVDLDCDDDDPSVGAITYEATADGVDQDCDGRVDEITVRPCSSAPDMVSAGDGAFCIDRFEASRPDATAHSPGALDGTAQSRQGVQPWVDVTYDVAAAACRAASKQLCPPHVFRQNCLHASGSPFPYGPTYDPAACNGADGLFARLMPTGSLIGCAGLSGAMDPVGNVSEWVEGRQVVGGSHQSGTAELSCQASVGYSDPAFSAPWVGFRCCKETVGGAR